jgi:hypothetical protein
MILKHFLNVAHSRPTEINIFTKSRAADTQDAGAMHTLRPGGSNMSNPGRKPGVEEPHHPHTTLKGSNNPAQGIRPGACEACEARWVWAASSYTYIYIRCNEIVKAVPPPPPK